jgi:hypothetical protein
MTAEAKKGKIQNIWMVVLAIFFLGFMAAGFWMTGVAMNLRADETNARISSQTEELRSEIARLRRDIRVISGQRFENLLQKQPNEPQKEETRPGK